MNKQKTADESAMSRANTVVVLDFETTGLSPDGGDRAIEIGAVCIKGGEVTGQFQQLMNPGRRVDRFIEDYTGITNKMLKHAPPCREVMHGFADFIGDYNLVAHNASFDKRFLDAELSRIGRNYGGQFACSMLAARRVYPRAPNHQLGTLVKHANIPVEGVFHRALYDAQMTARLWLAMLDRLSDRYAVSDIPFSLVQRLTRTPKHSVQQLFGRGKKSNVSAL